MAKSAAGYFGAPNLALAIAAALDVTAFFNELNVNALQVITNGKLLKCFAGEVAEPPPGTMEVHFVKLDNEDIDIKRIQQQVLVSSIRQDAIGSLYALISKIYVPLLRQGEREAGNEKNNQLRDLLYSLRAGLHRTTRGGGTNLQKFDFSPDAFRGVLDPLDEIAIWQELENETGLSAENEKMRKNAEIINRHFATVHK